MELRKVILIDPDEVSRRQLKKYVDWISHGFVVAGEAGNAEEAFHILEYMEVDLVVTEIEGTEMLGRLAERFPDTKKVICTHLRDFYLARQALKYQVSDYLLKPCQAEKMEETLARIGRELEEEQEQKRVRAGIWGRYQSMNGFLKTSFLQNLLSGSIKSEEEIWARWNMVESSLQQCCGFLPVAVRDRQGHEMDSRLHERFCDVAEELQRGWRGFEWETIRMFGKTAGILGWREKKGKERAAIFLQQLSKICLHRLETEVVIGVGACGQTVSELPEAYKKAVIALGYGRIHGTGSVIFLEKMKKTAVQIQDDKMEQRLFDALRYGEYPLIQKVLRELVECVEEKQAHEIQIRAYFENLAWRIVNGLGKTDALAEYSIHCRRISERSGGRISWFAILEELCSRLYQERTQECEARQRMEYIKNFIDSNFQNPDLSVEMLCREIAITPSYFSTIFKREYGCSFSSYITNVRLHKARELLRGTKAKNYMIADRIGYQDPNYFSHLFKKKFGLSPTQYRKQHAS